MMTRSPHLPPEPTPTRHPFVYAALYFPFGLTIGFPSIALGYLASQAHVPVAAIAAVIGVSWLASGWKFLWAPLADYTLSRKLWYRIAIALVSLGFIAMASLPIGPKTMPLLTAIVFLTSLSGTFIAFAVEGPATYEQNGPSFRGVAAAAS